MPNAIFIDTSVLTNLLMVPGKDQQVAKARQDFEEYKSQKVLMILPVTTMVETGNHIAQLSNGHDRRKCATKFRDLLLQCIAEESPWVLHSFKWDASFIESFVAGAGSGSDLVELYCQEIGGGDLFILTEMRSFAARPGVDVKLWTYDQALAARTSV